MNVLTIELIGLLLAAWKAPGWVKEIGLIALISGLLGNMLGLFQAVGVVLQAGDISPSLVWGGIGASLVTIIHGMLIYLVSLVIRIIRKPRLL